MWLRYGDTTGPQGEVAMNWINHSKAGYVTGCYEGNECVRAYDRDSWVRAIRDVCFHEELRLKLRIGG